MADGSLKSMMSDWLEVVPEKLSPRWYFFYYLLTLWSFSPLAITYIVLLNEGEGFTKFGTPLLFLGLYCSIALHIWLELKVFLRWARFCKLATLPFAISIWLFFEITDKIGTFLGWFLVLLSKSIGLLLLIAVIIFVIVGIFGILLFGFNQVF